MGDATEAASTCFMQSRVQICSRPAIPKATQRAWLQRCCNTLNTTTLIAIKTKKKEQVFNRHSMHGNGLGLGLAFMAQVVTLERQSVLLSGCFAVDLQQLGKRKEAFPGIRHSCWIRLRTEHGVWLIINEGPRHRKCYNTYKLPQERACG